MKSNDCEKLGVTELDPSWLFEGERTEFRHVIIAAVHHDYERISEAPKPIAGAEVMVQYTRAASVAKKIASWLHQEGWEAEPVTGPMASRLAMIPAADSSGIWRAWKTWFAYQSRVWFIVSFVRSTNQCTLTIG